MNLQSAITLINAATATGTSQSITTDGAPLHVAVNGITSATVNIEGSVDGSNWHLIGSALTANGLVTIANPPKFVRANLTTYVSGTITVKAIY